MGEGEGEGEGEGRFNIILQGGVETCYSARDIHYAYLISTQGCDKAL